MEFMTCTSSKIIVKVTNYENKNTAVEFFLHDP